MTELKGDVETDPINVIPNEVSDEKQSSTEIKNVNYAIVNPTSAEKLDNGSSDGTGCECDAALPKQLKGSNETTSGNQKRAYMSYSNFDTLHNY